MNKRMTEISFILGIKIKKVTKTFKNGSNLSKKQPPRKSS